MLKHYLSTYGKVKKLYYNNYNLYNKGHHLLFKTYISKNIEILISTITRTVRNTE